jgi:hypothetical protein
MAHELLCGLRTIAEKGEHRDIIYQNILIRAKEPFEKVLYYVLQPHFNHLPWERSKDKSPLNQENLDKSIAACNFPPEIECLLRGMLALDSNVRWTAQQSLECFEKYLSSKQ